MDPTWMCKQKWGGAIIPSLRLHTHISAQQVVSKSSLSWELLQPWYMWKFEVEVATWHVVEASVHIAWTQHGCAIKSGLVQYYPFGYTHPYMSHSSTTMDPTWMCKQEWVGTILSLRLHTPTQVANWQVVEASVHIAWSQHGCASKSGVVQ